MIAVNPKVIDVLNDVLSAELTAINQYFLHAEMFENWDYARLQEAERKQAMDEMRHAKTIIDRVLYLEGKPAVGLNNIVIGDCAKSALESDLSLQTDAVARLNDSIAVCGELGDQGSRVILERVLESDEAHLDWLEAQLVQIEQIGIENYLAVQIPI